MSTHLPKQQDPVLYNDLVLTPYPGTYQYSTCHHGHYICGQFQEYLIQKWTAKTVKYIKCVVLHVWVL